MTPIGFLKNKFEEKKSADAMVWRGRTFSYEWLLSGIGRWRERLDQAEVDTGKVVFLKSDFSPDAVALFLALAERRAILVPSAEAADVEKESRLVVSQAEFSAELSPEGECQLKRRSVAADTPLYQKLRVSGRAGLVLFSSGSSGQPKGVVHDLEALLEKFKTPRHCRRTAQFLLFDHIGGINTMLYSLSNAGCLVIVENRAPGAVLDLVEKHCIEVLPATPTFLNLILLSEAQKTRDLSSLKLVTYGTEPMPESTLKKFHEAFPGVELLQTYGLSEVGILRSKSKSSDSLWVEVGGEGFETRIIDGILQIRAKSAMLGYLNAPSPFTEDGWFVTGDAVETDGKFIRILGRKSGWINVGGQKVNPVEVESVIREMEEIADVTVVGEANFLLGQHVVANVTPRGSCEDMPAFKKQIKKFCASRLEAYKVPAKVTLVGLSAPTTRFKKTRASHA